MNLATASIERRPANVGQGERAVSRYCSEWPSRLHYLPVLFGEALGLSIEEFKDALRWPAEQCSFGRDDDRTIDEDRVRDHRIEDLIACHVRLEQPELGRRRSVLA